MNLSTIYSLVSTKSYWSRTEEEVWAAINAAARFLYQAVLKEQRGYWIKTDSSSLTFTSGTTVYPLPADVQQLMRMRERSSAQEQWRLVNAEDIRSDTMQQNSTSIGVSFDGQLSDFSFYGPYLDEAASQDYSGSEIQKISIAPSPVDSRFVELVYTAKFVEVDDQTSFLMIPSDGHDALIDFAVAECLRGNDDSLVNAYTSSGNAKMSMFLTVCRDRQIEQTRTVEPYLD